jgi:beta-galactosidase GanA
MRHIRAVDSESSTVIMVQVENEVGILGDSRDRSEAANSAFSGAVPAALMNYLESSRNDLLPEIRQRWDDAGSRSGGTWEEVFGSGPETDEIFMAWHYSRYIDHVVLAGKAAYDIPMFVNAWLNTQSKHGEWPTGGPLPHTMDIWLAGAPHIDLLTPDIYSPEFEKWCGLYTRRGAPLFIPEMHHNAVGARNVFYALGQHEAIGTSPFAFDNIEETLDAPLGKSYEALQQIAQLILEHQGEGRMIGFLLDEDHETQTLELGGYELTVSLDAIFGYKAETGYGLIIAAGPDEFVAAGSGFQVAFGLQGAETGKVGIGSVDEGEFCGGKWVPGRRLNGDENDQGGHWRMNNKKVHIGRCTVYRYE